MLNVLLPTLEKSNKNSRRDAKEVAGRVCAVTDVGKKYYVTKKVEYTCTCPDFVFRQKECKHIRILTPYM